jgi:hypothetical protein
MSDNTKITIFLSHSGEDRELSIAIAKSIRDSFAEIEVFNTSEPAYRFDANSSEGDKGLMTYLMENLDTAHIYLLLVTPRAVERQSKWIDAEFDAAFALRKERSPSWLDWLLNRRKANKSLYFIPITVSGAATGSFWESGRLRLAARIFTGLQVNDAGLFSREQLNKLHEVVFNVQRGLENIDNSASG